MGTLGNIIFNKSNFSKAGIFQYTSRVSDYWDSNAGGTYQGDQYKLDFNAQGYNAIYGNSNTVQPPAYKVYVWKKIN